VLLTDVRRPGGLGGPVEAPHLKRLRGLAVVIGRVLEPCVLRQEHDLDGADGPVALLADDHLGDVGLVGRDVVLVHGSAVQEEDDVGVLLERSALAKVRELGAEVALRARLHRARELGERDHRHVQLLGERLERAGDLGDLLLAIVDARAAAHELQVVDDEHVEAVLGFHAARLRACLEHGDAGTVVDEDLRLGEPAGGRGEPVPVRRAQKTRAHGLRVHLGFGAEHALHELLRGHLETEHEHLAAQRYTHVLRDVEREGRLAHAGPARDDDEVGGLEPRRLQVELLEAGGDAGDVLLALVEALDVLERVLEDLAHGQRAALEAPLGEAEDLALRVVDERLHVLLGVEGLGDDGGRRLDELAQHGHVAHDLRVRAEVGGDRRQAAVTPGPTRSAQPELAHRKVQVVRDHAEVAQRRCAAHARPSKEKSVLPEYERADGERVA